MIIWESVLKHAFNQGFESMFAGGSREHYVDSQINSASVTMPQISTINWSGPAKHSTGETETDCDGLVNVNMYQWEGTSGERMAVLITDDGDFVGIIDNKYEMVYVGNVGCHPIVATNSVVFLNSDGSTFMDFPKDLVKQSGGVVAEFIVETGKKFVNQQIH